MNQLVTPAPAKPAAERGRLFSLFAQTALLPEAIPFQDPIDEICARPPPPLLRGTFYLVLLMFITLIALGAFTRVDVVVVANGRLITATPPIVLAPMERAIIRSIAVHPGDAVTKGEILATLDPTFVDADTSALVKQARTLRAQVRRLQAEADNQPFAAATPPDDDDLLQATLYHQRQAEYTTRLRVFDEDIQRLQASLRTLDEGRASMGRELEIARSVENIRSNLMRLESGSKLSFLEAEAARMRAERDQQEAANRLPELRRSVDSRAAERQAFIDGWRRELLETLVTTRTQLAQVTSALTKASRLHDLVVIKAPADGVVLEVAARTAGSVLREAETLLTIVPSDVPMIAEVMIGSGDVGFTEPGAEVKLKVDAFPFMVHGMLSGRLLSIAEESVGPGGSADSNPAARGGAAHRARIELLDSKLHRLPPGATLFPGMTLTAEIKSGSRSLLSYFLFPLTRGLRESAREP